MLNTPPLGAGIIYFHWIKYNNPIFLYHSNFDLLIGLVLIAATIEGKCFIHRVFCFWPFRFIGIVGYSFYLLHPHVHYMNKAFFQHYIGVHLPTIFYSLVTLFLTALLSALTYSYIERPFIRKY